MIVVIQCAASKRADAGHLTLSSGKPIEFVAQPRLAPQDVERVYARPDDVSEDGTSWRRHVLRYNQNPSGNPLGLCPAYRLYRNKTYGLLVDRFGPRSVYILSAGWGLIPADFLTPTYDITFSKSAAAYKRRRKADDYKDFRLMPENVEGGVVFFGGKDYLPLFCSLTDTIRCRRIAYFNSAGAPGFRPGYEFRRFKTTQQTNWHYECAKAFLDGAIGTE